MRILTTLCGLLFAACLFGQSNSPLLTSTRQSVIQHNNQIVDRATTANYIFISRNDSLFVAEDSKPPIGYKIRRYQLVDTCFYAFFLKDEGKEFILHYRKHAEDGGLRADDLEGAFWIDRTKGQKIYFHKTTNTKL